MHHSRHAPPDVHLPALLPPMRWYDLWMCGRYILEPATPAFLARFNLDEIAGLCALLSERHVLPPRTASTTSDLRRTWRAGMPKPRAIMPGISGASATSARL